jgi:hypothetical protein
LAYLFIGANHSPESALRPENRNVTQNQTVREEFVRQSVSRVVESRRFFVSSDYW